jgi:hypothetical protein
MTAPEPTPTAEHIDAVALVIESAWSDGDDAKIAHRILTSTDPAVHAAMLAALVRAGVLTEDRERLVRACGCIANEEPAACCDPLASPHWERRYVTRWVAL